MIAPPSSLFLCQVRKQRPERRENKGKAVLNKRGFMRVVKIPNFGGEAARLAFVHTI